MNVRFRRGVLGLVLGLGALTLNACSEVEFLMHTAKRINGTQAATTGNYKVGKPYQIQGVWYYPRVDYDYDETGIASWYGPNFHGKKTANGERFDMNQLTAAHRTLPLPSYVRVTNLENGRSIVLKVNDRGPFAHGRILDVSRRGAQLLGFQTQGTAKVRVEIMADESRAVAARMRNQTLLAEVGSPIKVDAMPKPRVSAQALPPPGGGRTTASAPAPAAPPTAPETGWNTSVENRIDARVTMQPVQPTQIYVQAGAFAYFGRANRVRASLTGIGPVKLSQILVNGQDLYRVRVGPLGQVNDADRILDAVIRAGYPDARIIIDKPKSL